MAKEFIIREAKDWNAMVAMAKPVVGKKPFRIVLHRGLRRTIDQNALLHAVFADCRSKVPTFVWMDGVRRWPDVRWWKDELKSKLGLKEVHFDIDDMPTVIIKSTSEYSTKELSDFCEKIVAYMKTEYGVDINLPDDLKGAKI